MRYETDAGMRDVFLSNSDGHDVAVLQRLRRTYDRNGYRTDDPLSDEQWQGMIDLVAAAPELLTVCQCIAGDLEALLGGDDFSGMSDAEMFGVMLESLKAAIAKAEGTAK